jgi:AraC family ethanolamine operon transcriptional activator
MHISDVALKYGFFHPSHFSQDYKKMFGETPTQTLETGIRFSF